jgi:uncharacterized Zn-binding protein involved in type VI secretion
MPDPVTGKSHGSGVITGSGCTTVLIGGRPAAVTGDACTCIGAPNAITGGSTGVFIGGKPATRKGDKCAHGGKITGGLGSVLIGERGVPPFIREIEKENSNSEELLEPPREEREKIINQTIQKCIELLERKLKLLQCSDPEVMKDFEKWFGFMNEERIQIILHKVERALRISQSMTVNDFEDITNDFARSDELAHVRFWDEFHTVYLGDRFWKLKGNCDMTRVDVLLHEMSHFFDVGNTIDFDYGEEQCLFLSNNHNVRAFYNADNFMYFLKA